MISKQLFVFFPLPFLKLKHSSVREDESYGGNAGPKTCTSVFGKKNNETK